MTDPRNAIEAVTHANPYRFYAGLVERSPFGYDGSLGCWVAAGAAAVEAVLASDAVTVRPASEPVPRVIDGTAVGEVFGRLVRMTDGDAHERRRRVVTDRLAAIDPAAVRRVARSAARRLVDRLDPIADPSRAEEFAFRLPVHVVGELVGIPFDVLDRVAAMVGELVAGFSPLASAETAERGSAAAVSLLDVVRDVAGAGADRDVLANTVGLLTQSYEATAGAIGNTLVALARHPQVMEAIDGDIFGMEAVIDEVLRSDAPVQNTRRWVARDTRIAGKTVAEGDAILVVLAAANRDPDPFDPWRSDRRHFTFGAGAHACPGAMVSTGIAAAGVGALLACGVDLGRFATPAGYRPSVNTRIPVFAARSAAGEGIG